MFQIFMSLSPQSAWSDSSSLEAAEVEAESGTSDAEPSPDSRGGE